MKPKKTNRPPFKKQQWAHKCCRRGHIPTDAIAPERGVAGKYILETYICDDCGCVFARVLGKASQVKGPGGEVLVTE